MSVPALELDAITKRFYGITALNACSFSVERGTITSIIGPNGAGKTTLFNVISGLYATDSGGVLVNGTLITSDPAYARSRHRLARTFQAIRLFPEMSVLENMLIASPRMRSSLTSALFGIPSWRTVRTADTDRALQLLQLVGLREKAHVYTKTLSYGQRKIIELCRALMAEPELLLLDEPAAGVNRTTLQVLLGLIRAMRDEGKTVILIEHDMHVVMNVSDRIIVLDYGEVLAEGTPTEIQHNPAVIEAYLGKRKTR